MPPSHFRRFGSRLGLALSLALWASEALCQEPAGVAPAPTATLLDRIVAVVGDRLVMASDVALESALAARDPSAVPALRRRAADPLEAVIDAAVIRGLAGAVSLYQPDDGELRARLEALRASWEDPEDYLAFLKRFGLDEDALSGLLFSRIVVERYVHRNVGLTAEAAGDDEQAYFERYLRWIEAQRQRVLIRVVSPQGLEGRP